MQSALLGGRPVAPCYPYILNENFSLTTRPDYVVLIWDIMKDLEVISEDKK